MPAHNSWEEVLIELKSYPKDDGNYYIFTKNKDTRDEDRTRFMTYREAMVYVLYQVERKKLTKE